MRRIFISWLIALCATNVALCANVTQTTAPISLVGGGAGDIIVPTTSPDFVPISDINQITPNDTECATAVFADALANNSAAVSETDEDIVIRQWIYQTFANPDVLRAVMQCPEFANAADDETITLQPIKYVFPGGREIVINYETQPKILAQRITLGEKNELADLNPNPRIDPTDGTVWTNTDPAWYAIMVVESGTLDEFVGPGKNNTVSMRYINDNIDRLFPHGNQCTSKSALAGDKRMINVATRETVGIDNDTNDYYVAGDVSLQWISYLEIGLDVAITVLTMGGGTVILGATKSARASRALHGLTNTIKTLRTTDSVRDYVRLAQLHTKALAELKKINKLIALDDLSKINRITNASEYTRKLNELRALFDATDVDKLRIIDELINLDRTADAAEYTRRLNELRRLDDLSGTADTVARASKMNEIQNYEQAIRTLEQTDDNVRQYRNATNAFTSLNQYRRTLRSLRTPQRGNIIARAWRAIRAANTGGKTIRNAEKIARSSTLSGQIRDWLFQSTLTNAGALARLERTGGFIYGALRFFGGMYDWTETSTGEFTSGIDFKPLTLLSADDLQGQENVINHGMWLMWAGNAYSAADDDAAYLQAMDFANKFHFNLDKIQTEQNNHACNVDIFVVRPIIHNPGTDNAELYYLIMNDTPWTTRE